MARPDDRRDYISVLNMSVAVLIAVVGWFLADKVGQIKEEIAACRQDIRLAHAEIRAIGERVSKLEYSKH